MKDHSSTFAGIDVSKKTLDVALADGRVGFVVGNDAAGHIELVERLRALGVVRVGLEASGHYEAPAVAALRAAGLNVAVLDPRQIQGYRSMTRRRAKTDAIDAKLIAIATMLLDEDRQAPDPRLPALAEHLLFIDQMAEDIARLKTRLDRYRGSGLRREIEKEIARLEKQRAKQLRALSAKLEAYPDLAARYRLILSIPGIGSITALNFVIRMPELGRLSRAEAAALVGVAPYNADSGDVTGGRHIAGGRDRLRKAVYMAAFAASQRANPMIVTFYQRLKAAGKHHKVAAIACARKLVEIVNAVVTRGTPWDTLPPEKTPS